MITRDEILELADEGTMITTKLLVDMGHNRSQFQPHVASLVAEGLLFKHGRGNDTYYMSVPPAPVVKDPSRSRRVVKALPDLPKIMLDWLGYTDKVPDPDAGEFIHGGKW